MECPCCGKYYDFFNINNEVMKLNKFEQFLCTQCYTPLNTENKLAQQIEELKLKINNTVFSSTGHEDQIKK